ncbi:hypothetical protein DY000_02034366 [Brassica cretica]|uniref:Uncharacterized protein n=1 Tax=Brassica cretica TaxID=69181 RepID=A0ABQ7DHV4_BRACR|nr:hypothetical protein DY000_02034366 [Brassica cretica]
MQATINANRLSTFRERLSAGTMYSISGFDVARCAQKFKLTDSSLMIRFNDSTEFDVLTDPVSPLPEERFRFRNQTELVGLANTNNQLPVMVSKAHGKDPDSESRELSSSTIRTLGTGGNTATYHDDSAISSSGDNSGIESGLCRQARMLLRSSKTTPSSLVVPPATSSISFGTHSYGRIGPVISHGNSSESDPLSTINQERRIATADEFSISLFLCIVSGIVPSLGEEVKKL